jgi:[ribosomal protein S5]-alanine N-acetyltransferase
MKNNRGKNIYIREYNASDVDALLRINIDNRGIFEAITPVTREDSYYTRENFVNVIENSKKARVEGKRYDFGVFLVNSDSLIGSIGLYKFEPTEKCILGYSLDQQHHGKGYATEAVRLIVDFAFHEVGLHRIEAGVMPRNVASAKVLEKVGFTREGLARESLKIKGVWEDHYIYSLLEKDLIL